MKLLDFLKLQRLETPRKGRNLLTRSNSRENKRKEQVGDGKDTESVAVVVLPILSVLWVLQYIDATQNIFHISGFLLPTFQIRTETDKMLRAMRFFYTRPTA